MELSEIEVSMFAIIFIILVVLIYHNGSPRTKTVMKYMFGYWIYESIQKYKKNH